MSMSLMIFTRETTPEIIRFGTRAASYSTPSTRKRTRISPSSGSKWMSEAPSLDRLAEDRVDELDHRRVVGRLAQLGDLAALALVVLLLVDRLGDRALERVQAADQRVDVVLGGDRDAAVEPGHHLDVVDREHVRRVGHRDAAASRWST